MTKNAAKQCAFSIMQNARSAPTQAEAMAFFISARRVMTYGGFSPEQIDKECGASAPAIKTTNTEPGRPYVD